MTTFTCTFDCIKSTANVLGHTDIKALSMPRYYNVTFLEVETCLFNLVAFFFLQGQGGNSLRGMNVLFMSSTHPQGRSLPWGVGSVGTPTLSDWLLRDNQQYDNHVYELIVRGNFLSCYYVYFQLNVINSGGFIIIILMCVISCCFLCQNTQTCKFYKIKKNLVVNENNCMCFDNAVY